MPGVTAAGGRPGRRLDWRSGGWLILLAVLLVLAVAVWRVVPMLRSSGGAVGDGRHVDSYGFDLTRLLVPRDRIAAAGFPRDGVPALNDPPVMAAGEVPELNAAHRGKYLVSGDRVIGLEIAGEARAYPLRILNWHEVVNDTLGGVPIAVTYHPLCDSVVVFDRRAGAEVSSFGVSGLLYNSNLLLYDRRPASGAASLWSQLQARAIAGPAAEAGRRLEVLPASVTTWSRWTERHPRTTVLRPDPASLERYQRDPYGNYLNTGKPRFRVDPLPPEDSPRWMDPVLIVEEPAGRRIRLLDPESAAAGSFSIPDVEVDATERPASILVTGPEAPPVIYSVWFAWYSHHPETAREELSRSGG